MRTDENNPSHWFLLGAERLRGADSVFQQEGVTYTGVELLHEAMERYLKGYLIGKSWELRKIHDLSFLLDEAITYDPQFKGFSNLAESLTDQFWAQHYPGGDLTDVGSNYEVMRKEAGELIKLIEQLCKK